MVYLVDKACLLVDKTIAPIHIHFRKLYESPVADPGFPRGGGTRKGSSGRVGGQKHEIYVTAFGSHLFYD